MLSKSEQTKALILEKVAPVFNRKGYVATSMSDLTEATGLTKGAIYSHYLNKEELAVKAYRYMVKKVVLPVKEAMDRKELANDKLRAMTAYYRNYHSIAERFGGCPILNIGVDSHFTNPKLYQMAREIAKRMENDLTAIIEAGKKQNYFNPTLDSGVLSAKIFSMIEGGIFLSMLHKDGDYLSKMMEEVDNLLTKHKI